jgi:queuine tRNA-ribosyltransferase accessory subunit
MRRNPPLLAAMANSNQAAAICTSVGFRAQTISEYNSTPAILQPDIFIAATDIPKATTWGLQRAQKMCERTGNWVERLVTSARSDAAIEGKRYGIFAPVLPLPVEQQRMYLQELGEMAGDLDGLAIHDPVAIPDLPPTLRHLPHLSLKPPSSPTEIFTQIHLGVDIFTIPFINNASDAGIALTFQFPAPASSESGAPAPLAMDLWPSAQHATSLEPLVAGCSCYSCTTNHRAYINHLLQVKEMLSWTLLQIHNHHVMDLFFFGIRTSIAKGTLTQDYDAFKAYYEADLPAATGQGPRVRGYQYKSEGPGEKKRNISQFGKLDGIADAMAQNSLAEAETPDAVAGAKVMQEHGLGKTV